MIKADRSVVRNQAYQKSALSIRERHNERQNETYYNSDIQKDRQGLNVYYKRCDGSYVEAFDAMVAAGVVNIRGQKKDGSSKVVDELVFDVNTDYFDRNGGYEYAKSFFEEAYRYAVKEIGGERFILSAVMHADERNKALSERHGRDIYHYHLHVVYVPVVDKDVYFKKDNKDPELAGKLKERIKQVSHSKKWPRYKTEKGWVNSYSLLQDRYFEHMKEAGFIGFERGERGSTAEHLSVLEFKAKMESERVAAMTAEVGQKQEAVAALDATIGNKKQAVAALDAQAGNKKKQMDELDEKITDKTKAAATAAEIDAMGKPHIFGGVVVTTDEMKKLKTLAKKSAKADEKLLDMKQKLRAAEKERDEAKAQIEAEKKERPSITCQLTMYGKFIAALKRAPKRLMALIEEILRQPPERQEPNRTGPDIKRKVNER